ncbi:MAG: helix-turn-helix domain-containing protein [Armatimonadetes bacterium]|nr:helix-turn-helix domain-containing protein [Armatimonadota bacterium]
MSRRCYYPPVDISTETGRKLLATRIQSAIAEAGHDSLAAFARKMGVTRGLVHNYVAGTTLPPLDRLQAIADLCGKPLTWFLLDDPSATTADAESLRSERDALQTNVEALASQLASERERRAAEKDRHDAAMLETVRELCLAYRRLGDTAALLEAAPRLLELARDRGASKAVLEARLHMGHAWFERSDLPRARASLEKALETARDLGDTRAERSVLQEMVRVLQASGNLIAARDHALALAHSDAWWSRWAGRVSLAALEDQAGYPDAAQQYLDEAQAIAEADNQPQTYVLTARTYILSNRVNLALSRGDYGLAGRLLADLREIAAQASQPDQVREAVLNEAIVLLRTGRLSEAAARLEALGDWAELAADARLQALVEVLRSEMLRCQADSDGARNHARLGIEKAIDAGRGHVLAEAELALGLAYLDAGRPADADYHIARAESRAAKLQWRRLQLAARLQRARCRMADDPATALDTLRTVLQDLRQAGCRDLEADALVLLARLEKGDQAREHARQAVEIAREIGYFWGERQALPAIASMDRPTKGDQ